ncbi:MULTISPECIES: winged helix-turn-helix transcriptional regulator [Novosphingobium]|jgi:DNA-binding HxlR family transcriptional regulator|uniref:winged helix-turn-helix transcriptional regulator n=1 Tax=Novosphingobium TaxID=165696 RepID=UPI0022F26BB9|nr:helix-turn-helix domain-containing protein [Novosphingobium resinovorum]
MKSQKETIRSESATDSVKRAHGRWYGDACGAAFAMELIGERWSLPIIREMMLGPRRFSEIRAELPGLSAKTLTERLESLEGTGIVTREVLPPPASVQVYRLTEWGLALEPVMQELGRWAVRSTLHDPTLPITPVSLMLSLRTMIHPERIGDLALTVRFEVGVSKFTGRLGQGELAIHPSSNGDPDPDLVFAAEGGFPFLAVFYGKWPREEVQALRIEGDPSLVQRFVDLFSLPPKCAS